MPKNKKGGKKFKKGKNNAADDRAIKNVRMIEDKLERYARVKSAMGDRRLAVETSVGETIVAHIPGKFRKRVWISAGDIILISLRPFDLSTGDVLSKYSPQEARFLIRKDEIKDTFANLGSTADGSDNGEEDGINISWKSGPALQAQSSAAPNDDYYANLDLPPSSSEYSDEEDEATLKSKTKIIDSSDSSVEQVEDWRAMLDEL
jgi:translation initiation factor 1A